MAKKHKGKHFVVSQTPAEIRVRVINALAQERTQHALELARTLFKLDRSPEHLQLLQTATLERARQLRRQGQTRDAASLLTAATDMGGADFLRQVAEELSFCGQAKQALKLLEGTNADGVQSRILTAAADAALREGSEGRKGLPEALHPQFDLIMQAFAHLEAGRDEEVRVCLQEIGLTSPFLEWKLLLRGLLAYWNNDDARALENWSRLDHQRVPARLAAPFRLQIDSAFRDAQEPAAQVQLREVNNRLQGTTPAAQLRRMQACLVKEDGIAEALRLLTNALPLIKQELPNIVPRLANCFYWGIINRGEPEDGERFRRLFGAPADDPQLLRLKALALEERHLIDEANEHWQKYANDLENLPSWHDRDLLNKARALIWCHMGNLSSLQGPGRQLPHFMRGMLPKFTSFVERPPEECYKKSIAYDPSLLDAHEALFLFLRSSEKLEQAVQAGRELIKRFPDHVETLEDLGDACLQDGESAEAVTLFRQALQHNPLEKRLRGKLSRAHLVNARRLAKDGEFAEARSQFENAFSLGDTKVRYATACASAAMEYKAGDKNRGDELLEQARLLGGVPLDLAFRMTAETGRLQLPTKVRSPFTKEFTAGLTAQPSAAAAARMLETLKAFAYAKVEYYGSKSHLAKVIRYAERAADGPATEEDLEAICDNLLSLRNLKVLRKLINKARRSFPRNPVFVLLFAELTFAASSGIAMWQLPATLETARTLIDGLPPGERKEKLLERIAGMEDALKMEALKRFPFESIMNSMYGDEDDDDDDMYF